MHFSKLLTLRVHVIEQEGVGVGVKQIENYFLVLNSELVSLTKVRKIQLDSQILVILLPKASSGMIRPNFILVPTHSL